MNTMIVRKPPEGEVVGTVEFPPDMEGHGLAHYVITEKPPLRGGMDPRFLVYLVLDVDGLCLNDNLPVACKPTLALAIARASAGFDTDEEEEVAEHGDRLTDEHARGYAAHVEDEIARDNEAEQRIRDMGLA